MEQNFAFLLVKMLGSLALLVFGMKYMSEALQKLTGPQLRNTLSAMTGNRFTGILTGMLVTVAVQSSAATTVMTVSFVNAQLLSLAQAISVIMGANIGTTLSAWIMSAGFSFNLSDLVWPVFLIGIVLIYSKRRHIVGEFLFGVAFLFFALGMLSITGKEMDLAHNAWLTGFFGSFDPSSYLTILTFLLIGTILTIIAQSSAAIMAITMVLCTSGVLPIHLGIALVMGENIGTTVTANVAALTGNVMARRAAMAHLLFNVFGVTWVLIVFFPFVDMVCSLVHVDPHSSTIDPARLSFVLATFHSCFNVINTLVLVWCIPLIERAVCWIIKDKEQAPEQTAEEPTMQLQYINGGIMSTPEIAVLQAQREVQSFGTEIQDMFNRVRLLMVTDSNENFDKGFKAIEDEEDNTDRREYAIAEFLAQVSLEHLSDETKEKVRIMMRQIGEIESIGDGCYNLARTMKRFREKGKHMDEHKNKAINMMMELVDKALSQMNVVLRDRDEVVNIKLSLRLENEINALRTELKSRNAGEVDNHTTTYDQATAFTDLVCECERIGDYIINVVQAKLGK